MTLQDVIDEMLATPYARTYKDDYIYVRCPICGDSQKHLDGSHCSIWLRPGLPLVYHCWICESSGLVDKDFLRDLNITDPNIITAAVRYNRETMKNKDVNDKFVSPINAKNILIPKIEENKITRPKIEYMRERLGVDFTVKSLEYLRCVTSIYDFLALNHLNPTEKFVDTVKFLEKYAIGFLSTDRTYIVFRNVDKKMKFRYMKYPVFNGLNIGSTSYTIPSQVDIMEPSVDLHIAEGTFDILSVFFNVRNAETKNSIYSAVCGSGYKSVIRSFMQKGLMTNLNVHIYSDSDKDIDYYEFVLNLKSWFNKISIYYNGVKGEEDFGVPKSRIKLKKAVIRGGIDYGS